MGRRRDVVFWLGVSYDNIFDCNVYHPKIVANYGSFFSFKVLTDRFNNTAPSGTYSFVL